jgi:hypothetical protein
MHLKLILPLSIWPNDTRTSSRLANQVRASCTISAVRTKSNSIANVQNRVFSVNPKESMQANYEKTWQVLLETAMSIPLQTLQM